MKKLFGILILGMFAVMPALAEDDLDDPTTTKKFAMPAKTSTLSIHPFSLIISSATDFLPMYVYLTYEKNLAPKVAFILTPNYLTWNIKDEVGDGEFSMSGYGIGIGARRYLSKPVSGPYLQAKLDLGYSTVEIQDNGDKADASGLTAAILGYFGAKGKWDNVSIFWDIGLGVAFASVEAKLANSDLETTGSGKGLAYEMDFGIGYSF